MESCRDGRFSFGMFKGNTWILSMHSYTLLQGVVFIDGGRRKLGGRVKLGMAKLRTSLDWAG